MAAYIDSHCHLDFSFLSEKLEVVLRACAEEGVGHFIVPAVGRSNWRRVLALGAQHGQIAVGLGMHPYFIASHCDEDLECLRGLIVRHRADVCAVGEIGLDRMQPMFERQKDLFLQQLELAREYDLPVIVHSRKTHGDVLWCLKRAGVTKGVVHAFSGSRQEAEAFVSLGMKLGAGSVLVWPRGSKVRSVFASMGSEHVLLETDAPDMPLPGQQTGQATPANISRVFEALHAVREESPEQLRARLWDNTVALFGLHHWVNPEV